MNVGSMKARRITQHKTKHLYALSALLFLGIVGTYAYTFGTFSKKDAALSSTTESQTGPTSVPEMVDVEGAREIAQAQKPGVTVTKVDSVPVNGQITTYTVHFTDGTKLDVAAEDGAIVKKGETQTASENTQPSDTSSTSTATTPTSTTPTPPADEPIPPAEEPQNPTPNPEPTTP